MLIVLLLECGGYFVHVEPALLGILIMSLHALGHLLCALCVSYGTLLLLDLLDAALALDGLDTMSRCGCPCGLLLIIPLEDALKFFPKRDFFFDLGWMRN